MKTLHGVAFWLVIIGGVNWGLMGIGSFLGVTLDLVYMLVGSWSLVVADIIYVLVGVSAVYLVITHNKDCKCCEAKPVTGQPQV